MTGTKNIRAIFLTLAIALFALVSSVSADPIYYSENGHYYDKISVSDGINWNDAKIAAQSLSYLGMSGHLATITDQNESDFINLHFYTTERYWLGGFQQDGSTEPDGGWQWITGESWEYTDWMSGEPNNNYSDVPGVHPIGWPENAVETHYGSWNDYPSDVSTTGGYIVEYEPKNLTITAYNLNYLESTTNWRTAPKLSTNTIIDAKFLVWEDGGLDATYKKRINIVGCTTEVNQIYGVSTADYSGNLWGQCVSLVKALSKSKEVTGNWIKGDRVINTIDLAPGTVIATFGPNDKYISAKGSHAAIFRDYIKNSKGEKIGIQVWDQNYVQSIKNGNVVQEGAVGRHNLYLYTINNKGEFTSKIRSGENGANDYFVVQVP